MKEKLEVQQGTLVMMVLKTLDVLGPQHGWGIARLREHGTLQIEENLLADTFDPHDALPSSNGEVVISDGLWKRAFGADPRVVGKSCHPNDLLWDADEFTL